MLEIALIIALVGLSVSGLWDLFTTEVPDEIPYLMITIGIFIWYVYALSIGNFQPLLYSLFVGFVTLVVGLLMYKQGAWGGADAWLLAATGFLVPLYNEKIFMIDYVSNLLIVGASYMIIYAVALGFLNPHVKTVFYRDLKGSAKFIALPLLLAVVALFFEPALAYVLFIIGGLLLFWRYAKIIENHVFRKKIKVGELKPGDVTEDMIWRGITQQEITAIEKRKKYIIIKEGVRFVPAFPITLIVTLLYGNLLIYLI